jgi:hypothetical protein
MRMIYLEYEKKQQDFAIRAAKHFVKNKEHASYSDGEIEPGCLLALRWGAYADCILVLKLSENHIPTNYQQLVREYEI